MQKIKRATLLDELMHFSEKAWHYTDASTGEVKRSYKATREPGSQSIVFRTIGNRYNSESFGETVNWVGIPEEVTYKKWKEAQNAKTD